jgi:hypothetical protein
MGQALKLQISKKINDRYDVKAIKTSLHYFILLGISIYAFMDMENRLTLFKSKTNYSISERKYEQEETYKKIMDQIEDYDGEGVPLENPDLDLPEYRYEASDSD